MPGKLHNRKVSHSLLLHFVLEQIFKLNLASVMWRQYCFSISLRIDPFQLALLLLVRWGTTCTLLETGQGQRQRRTLHGKVLVPGGTKSDPELLCSAALDVHVSSAAWINSQLPFQWVVRDPSWQSDLQWGFCVLAPLSSLALKKVVFNLKNGLLYRISNQHNVY